MKLTLKIWRQKNNKDQGRFELHTVDANEHMSFLEMLDVLNESLLDRKQDTIAFELW